jgi:drug/metabolite transporter (DMT)-like permease
MLHLLFVSIIWGFSFVLIKGTLVPLDPSFVSFARLLLSFVAFMPFIRLAGIRLLDKLQLMLIGGIQFGLMYVAYVAAYQYLPAHVIALMTTTTPLFVTVFNDLYKKKVHTALLLAALLAVTGGAVIKFPDQPLSANLYGIVLLQVSNATFAFGQIAYKRLLDSRRTLQDKNVFGLTYGGAVIVTGSFSMATTDFNHFSVQPQQWLALLYLGIVASGLCFFLWNLGARKVNEGTLAVMNNLKIPIGVIASLVILGEDTDYARLLAGCALLAMALWVNCKFGNRARLRDLASNGSPTVEFPARNPQK